MGHVGHRVVVDVERGRRSITGDQVQFFHIWFLSWDILSYPHPNALAHDTVHTRW